MAFPGRILSKRSRERRLMGDHLLLPAPTLLVVIVAMEAWEWLLRIMSVLVDHRHRQTIGVGFTVMRGNENFPMGVMKVGGLHPMEDTLRHHHRQGMLCISDQEAGHTGLLLLQDGRCTSDRAVGGADESILLGCSL